MAFWADGAVDPFSPGREAIEGHHVNRFMQIKGQAEPARGVLGSSEYGGGEGLGEIFATDLLTGNPFGWGMQFDGGGQSVPVAGHLARGAGIGQFHGHCCPHGFTRMLHLEKARIEFRASGFGNKSSTNKILPELHHDHLICGRQASVAFGSP